MLDIPTVSVGAHWHVTAFFSLNIVPQTPTLGLPAHISADCSLLPNLDEAGGFCAPVNPVFFFLNLVTFTVNPTRFRSSMIF